MPLTWEEVANWTSVGSKSLGRFQKVENLGFPQARSEVSGIILVDRKVVSIGPD